MKFCPKCGTQLGDEAAFCNNCGSPIKAQPPVHQYSAPQPPVQQFAPQQYVPVQPTGKKNTKTVIAIAVVAVLVIVGIVAGIILLLGDNDDKSEKSNVKKSEVSSSKAVTEAFVQALLDGNNNKMCNLLSPEFEQYIKNDGRTLKDFCEYFISEFEREVEFDVQTASYRIINDNKGALREFKEEFSDFGVNLDNIDEIAYVTVEITGDDEDIRAKRFQFTASKEDDVWYIFNGKMING